MYSHNIKNNLTTTHYSAKLDRMQTITIIKPDDMHCHLRDGAYLERTVADISRTFARAIVMPNLVPPVTTVQAANDYLNRIKQYIPNESTFTPLMTLYLTEQMNAQTIRDAKTSGFIYAIKLYPAGATTNSAAGVSDLQSIYPLLETMQAVDLPLLIHGESIDPNADIFDREKIFLENDLEKLITHFPKLRIVLEHISTKEAVDFVKSAPDNIAATITAHHLYCNRNDIFHKGIRPHYYCLPILKRREDQQALVKAATSGDAKFFLGTDSAPHAQHKKENPCGCAGIYTALNALEIYTQIFDEHNALNQLENFASKNGANFYGLPINESQITLIRKKHHVPNELAFGENKLIPFHSGQTLYWQST
jgi:dihydroorotase